MARLKSDDFQYYDVVMENAKICFRTNFEGREVVQDGRVYNVAGKRNFDIVVDDPETKMNKRWFDQETGQFMTKAITADDLAADDWNLKIYTPKSEDGAPFRHTKIQVSYKLKTPRISMVINGKDCPLDEETVKNLDDSHILSCDIVFRSHPWTSPNGSGGVNGYLSEGHFIVEPSAFGDKYQ